jgi:hypothetical protein
MEEFFHCSINYKQRWTSQITLYFPAVKLRPIIKNLLQIGFNRSSKKIKSFYHSNVLEQLKILLENIFNNNKRYKLK